jgi:hypothetical protein
MRCWASIGFALTGACAPRSPVTQPAPVVNQYVGDVSVNPATQSVRARWTITLQGAAAARGA